MLWEYQGSGYINYKDSGSNMTGLSCRKRERPLPGQGDKSVSLLRSAEPITLRDIGTMLAQESELRLSFHTLTNHFQIQAIRHGDDCLA
jgi:hypothetical protein